LKINILSPFRAIAASIRLSWWKLRGFRIFVTEDEELERLAICYECESFVPETEQCAVCTCWVNLKTKLASEQCPKRKWLRLKSKPITFTCHVE